MCPGVITSEFVSTSGEPSYGQRWLWMLGQEVQGPLMSRAWGEKGEKTDFKAKEGQFSCDGGWAGSRAGRQWGCGMRGSRSTGFTLGQAFLRRVLGKPMQSSTLFILSLPVLLFFLYFLSEILIELWVSMVLFADTFFWCEFICLFYLPHTRRDRTERWKDVVWTNQIFSSWLRLCNKETSHHLSLRK